MIKSIIFYFLLFIWTLFLGILFIPLLFSRKEKLYSPIYFWIKGVFFLLKTTCDVSYEIRGINYVNNNPTCTIAPSHKTTLIDFFF